MTLCCDGCTRRVVWGAGTAQGAGEERRRRPHMMPWLRWIGSCKAAFWVWSRCVSATAGWMTCARRCAMAAVLINGKHHAGQQRVNAKGQATGARHRDWGKSYGSPPESIDRRQTLATVTCWLTTKTVADASAETIWTRMNCFTDPVSHSGCVSCWCMTTQCLRFPCNTCRSCCHLVRGQIRLHHPWARCASATSDHDTPTPYGSIRSARACPALQWTSGSSSDWRQPRPWHSQAVNGAAVQ